MFYLGDALVSQKLKGVTAVFTVITSLAEQKKTPEKSPGFSFFNGGYYRDRTYDLLYVKQMLSQLS